MFFITLTEMGFLSGRQAGLKHAAKILTTTPSQEQAIALSHCPLMFPWAELSQTGQSQVRIRLHAPSDTTKPTPHPFFSMDSHILMQKASKDNVALFQHAILGYYTMPSRGLLIELTGEILHALLDWEEERGAGIWKLPPHLASRVGFSYTIPAPAV